MRIEVFKPMLAMAACSLAILFAPVVNGQESDLFATASVERRVKKQFRLTSGEMKRLHPHIERENAKLTAILARYAGSENSDFLSLWNALRISRLDTDPQLIKGLTSRQVRALNAARTTFESEIIDKWVEGYVEFLAEFLDLDPHQFDLVMRIFKQETRKRRPLMTSYSDTVWDKLTDEREGRLRSVLTPEQQRDYDQLFDGEPKLVA